jgi:hypothetical protein
VLVGQSTPGKRTDHIVAATRLHQPPHVSPMRADALGRRTLALSRAWKPGRSAGCEALAAAVCSASRVQSWTARLVRAGSLLEPGADDDAAAVITDRERDGHGIG